MPYYDIKWKRSGVRPGQSMEDKRARASDVTRLFADSNPDAESQWDRQYSAGGMFERVGGATEVTTEAGASTDDW